MAHELGGSHLVQASRGVQPFVAAVSSAGREPGLSTAGLLPTSLSGNPL